MRVTITDGLAEELISQLPHSRRQGIAGLDAEVEQRLTETLHAPGSRVVLSLEELELIAQALGTGLPLRNKLDLQRAVESASRIHLGDVRLVWTPTQLKQIEEKARKIGETTERLIARVAARVLTDVFMVQPAAEGVLYTPGFDPTDEIEDEEPGLDEEPDAAGP